jgi:hypothetical protein
MNFNETKAIETTRGEKKRKKNTNIIIFEFRNEFAFCHLNIYKIINE